MGSRSMRLALWVLVALLVATPLATLATAQAATPNYTLSGSVRLANGVGYVRAGVGVELINSVTHQTLRATTASGGTFQFSTGTTGGALQPGVWGLGVPAQTNLSLGGSSAWAVLPSGPGPTYSTITSANLTSPSYRLTTSASMYQLSGTVSGTLTAAANGCSPDGAAVQIVSPNLLSFALNSTTSAANGSFSFHAPTGSWLLQAYCSAAVTWYSVRSIFVNNSGPTNLGNVALQPLFAQGYIYQAGGTTPTTAGGNVTLYDTTDNAVLSGIVYPGFYSVGTTPSTGPWVVLVNPAGYETVGYTTATAGITRDVTVPSIGPAGTFATRIAFAPGFNRVAVSTNTTLGNDSTFPDLANASVGQLWSQLGLDFNGGSLGFAGTGPGATAFQSWLASQGQFWAADQANLKVNGTTFGAPTTSTYTAPTLPAGTSDYTTSAGMSIAWANAANSTSAVPSGGNGPTYTISFGFRYPVGPLDYNYTIALPAGYALAANTAKPANSVLVPSGPDGSWRNFTLSAKPVSSTASAYGTANFTVVRYASITANVNITVAAFDFSSNNVVNSTRSNYSVVVGAGQNVTFSAQNTSYPDGTNGTAFRWDFGGATQTTTAPTAYHTYTVPGKYVGYVNVTSSGGRQSQTGFTVLVGNSPPTAVITSNATASEIRTSGGDRYLLVNWSRTLQFNLTGSASTLASNLSSPAGVLNVASWALTSTKYNQTANYTAASGAKVDSNFTVQFLGAGRYLKGATIGGQPVTFQGWEYNMTLTLWDGQGHRAVAVLPILVKDTQKPIPVVALQNSRGQNLTSTGIVEAANHTAYVLMNGQYSYDPNNGSIAKYSWHLTNAGNTSVHTYYNSTSAKWGVYLDPQSKPYTVNLTVTDLAGNTAYATTPLTVSINGTLRPILTATNLSAPGTMQDGSSYTIMGNVTNSGGVKSIATDVVVNFYLLHPGGTGSRVYIVPSSDVEFYGFTNGVMNSTPLAKGVLPTLAYNQTVRAKISWDPAITGSYVLYMNATSSNLFVTSTGPNVVNTPVTLNQNQNQLILEIVIIVVVVAAIIGVIVFLLRRGTFRRGSGGGRTTSSSSKSGLERGGKKPATEKPSSSTDDEDEDS